jgi:uncharacterized protein Yka (UPF0111/DUF47 family)
MLTKAVVAMLCFISGGMMVYFTQVFHHLENNFDAVERRFEALEKLFVKMNRNVETHSEVFHDTYAEIGKLKHEYERLRCYVYNTVPQHTEEEEDTEDAV